MEELEAKEILSANFIGTKELERLQNHFAVRIPETIPSIPFEKDKLEGCRGTHLLILCTPQFSDGTDISIETIRLKVSLSGETPCFYNQDWYLKEEFIKKQLGLKWLLVSKSVLDESRAIPAEKVVSMYRLHSAVELTFAFFANYFVTNGEKLWNNDYVWCSEVDDKGDQIYVGRYTDASGLNADGFEIHRHLRIKKNYGVV